MIVSGVVGLLFNELANTWSKLLSELTWNAFPNFILWEGTSERDPVENLVPFRAPEFHSFSGIQRANQEEEWDADGSHSNTESFELVISRHVCHSED